MPIMTTPQTDTAALAEQAANLFLQAFGNHPGFRLAHAKGIVCEGTFEASPAAMELSRAAHFNGKPVPVIVRFSNATGLPQIPDGDPNSNPKGMAIAFKLPGGGVTDIVANGQNGFPAGTPADFVDFFGSILATRPDSPKPTPFEKFLATHPNTARFLPTPQPATGELRHLCLFRQQLLHFRECPRWTPGDPLPNCSVRLENSIWISGRGGSQGAGFSF